MQLKTKQRIIIEEVFDEDTGEKLGEIRLNPNDTKIMAKLSKIVKDLTVAMNKINSIGEVKEMSNQELKTLDDFEKEKENIQKMCSLVDIESEATKTAIDDLSEVLGKETVEIFTGGTYDIELLLPLINFLEPHIKNAREQKMSKYLKKEDIEVFE